MTSLEDVLKRCMMGRFTVVGELLRVAGVVAEAVAL